MNQTDIEDKLNKFISTIHISDELAGLFIEMGEIVILKRKEYFVRQGEICRYLGAVLDGNLRFSYCDTATSPLQTEEKE